MCLAIPGLIEGLVADASMGRTGRVRFGGIVKEVNLSLVPEAVEGDYVIVHVGFAISRLDRDEAEKTLAYLDQIAFIQETA